MLTFLPEANIHIHNHLGNYVRLTTAENVEYYYNSENKAFECSFSLSKCELEQWNDLMSCLKKIEDSESSSWYISIEEFLTNEEGQRYGRATAFDAVSYTKTRQGSGQIQFCFMGKI